MFKNILLLLTIWNTCLNAQNNEMLLLNSWTKTKVRMLDGTKDLSEPYAYTKFLQWQFSNGKLCMNSDPIYFNPVNCMPYKIEKDFIRTSPNFGYMIEKITSDSLVLSEKTAEALTNDKIKKWWFVKSNKITNELIEKTKNDSVITATENLTPILTKNLILEINQTLSKKNLYRNYNIIGNLIFFPNEQKIKVEIENISDEQKSGKIAEIEKSIIENSFSFWNLKNFTHYKKVILPFIIENKVHSVDSDYTYKGAYIFFFTNNTSDIPKYAGIKYNDLQEAKKKFNDGLLDFQNKKYNSAIQYFLKSYKKDNRNVDALYNVATIYSLLNDKQNSCKTLKILQDLEQTEGSKLYKENCLK